MTTLETDTKLQFWLRVRAGLGVILVVGVFSAVWLVAFGADSGPGPVLPDTAEQFSLDLSIAATLEHEVVYVVEQRARPMYRIFAFDPSSGTDETIFTVPEDAIIYGIALSPERDRLAVAYATDFNEAGNGIWLIDLNTLRFEMLASQEIDVYLTELEWSESGEEIYATHVDRRGDIEALSIAAVNSSDGVVDVIINNAINPAVDKAGLFFLTVDEERARRAIGYLDESGDADQRSDVDNAGAVETIEVLDGTRDLDHLIADRSRNDLLAVAVLEDQDEDVLSIGDPAAAHGNHNIRSAWWSVEDRMAAAEPTEIEPIIVYDAAMSESGAIVYATLEGLSIADDKRIDLIKSRAIRFVAA